MTAQKHDTITFREQRFDIVGVAGTGLFRPGDHGLTPKPEFSLCWRGFDCGYAVERDQLLLKHVGIDLGDEDAVRGVHLFGRYFEPRTRTVMRFTDGFEEVTVPDTHFSARGLHEKVGFNGGLLLGAGFMEEMHERMHLFMPVYLFRVVHELTFEGGSLVKDQDKSQAVADFRASLTGQTDRPWRTPDDWELKPWMRSTFSRDYSVNEPY